MKFGFAPNLAVEVTKHSATISAMDKGLNTFLKDKNYGKEIAELYIGIVSMSPEFVQFFKPRPPKYIKGKKSYTKDEVHYMLHNTFEYDIIIDFETLKKAKKLETQTIIASELLRSLDLFKRFKGFNSQQFKFDLENFFKSKGWL